MFFCALSILCAFLFLSPQSVFPLMYLFQEGELSILRGMVAAGACDGVTGRCEETVDGLPWDMHVRILQQLREVAIDTPT